MSTNMCAGYVVDRAARGRPTFERIIEFGFGGFGNLHNFNKTKAINWILLSSCLRFIGDLSGFKV